MSAQREGIMLNSSVTKKIEGGNLVLGLKILSSEAETGLLVYYKLS